MVRRQKDFLWTIAGGGKVNRDYIRGWTGRTLCVPLCAAQQSPHGPFQTVLPWETALSSVYPCSYPLTRNIQFIGSFQKCQYAPLMFPLVDSNGTVGPECRHHRLKKKKHSKDLVFGSRLCCIVKSYFFISSCSLCGELEVLVRWSTVLCLFIAQGTRPP